MSKLKQLWKYQLYLNVVFIVFVIMMLFLNQIFVKDDLILVAKHSYVFTFLVANSQKTFDDVTPLLLKLLLFKDIIFVFIIGVLLSIYTCLYRSIVKHIYGYVKFFFISIFLLTMYTVVIFNSYLLVQIGLWNAWSIFASVVLCILLIGMSAVHFMFFNQYRYYRKESNLPIWSRQSLLNLSFKMIKNTTIIVVVVFTILALCIIVGSKVSIYLIHKLSLENYFDSLYKFDAMQLFKNIPPIMQRMILDIKMGDWFYNVQSGVVIIDVHSIDTRMQTKLASIVNEQATIFLVMIVKETIFCAFINTMNILYKRARFTNNYYVYGMVICVMMKLIFVQNNFFLFRIYDILFAIAVFMYIVDVIDNKFYAGNVTQQFVNVKRIYLNSVIEARTLGVHSLKMKSRLKDMRLKSKITVHKQRPAVMVKKHNRKKIKRQSIQVRQRQKRGKRR
ncbi:MAG: hypothetical protein ACRCV7_03100 [Culicoidibacterales bacterium]